MTKGKSKVQKNSNNSCLFSCAEFMNLRRRARKNLKWKPGINLGLPSKLSYRTCNFRIRQKIIGSTDAAEHPAFFLSSTTHTRWKPLGSPKFAVNLAQYRKSRRLTRLSCFKHFVRISSSSSSRCLLREKWIWLDSKRSCTGYNSNSGPSVPSVNSRAKNFHLQCFRQTNFHSQ